MASVIRVSFLASLTLVGALGAALLVACGGGEEADQAPQPPAGLPAGVPESARPAQGSFGFGRIERAFGPNPDVSQARTLEGMACAGDLLMIRTDQEIVYARMPCDRFLTPEQVASLEGQPAAIRLDASQGQRLIVESPAGSAEFSVSGVWVEER